MPSKSPLRPQSLQFALIAAGLLWSAAAIAQPADFSGAWQSTYGVIEITQDGNAVRGSYTYGTGSTIEGTVEDNRLTFRYREPDAAGDGWFQMNPGGDSFTGSWRQDNTSVWYPWSGQRSSQPSPEQIAASGFQGLFETTYGRMRLFQTPEGVVSGTYSYGSGSTINGQLEGNRLTFRYQEPAVAGDGWFELAEDGQSFAGQWREDGSTAWAEWTGQRIHAEPGISWLVVLEAHWETSLAENEYAFGEMLRTYFERIPNVRVRHRRFYNREDFVRTASEIAYLAEPVSLLIAGHGTEGRLVANDGYIQAPDLAGVLSEASNVFMVHFSSCEMLMPAVTDTIFSAVGPDRKLALSGYAVAVDWAASALLEFLYLDLVLGRGLPPSTAANLVQQELSFSSDTGTPGSPLGAAHFRFVEQ